MPSEGSLRPVLDQRYVAMRSAMASGEREAILALLAPDFVSEDLDGRCIDGLTMADRVVALKIDRSKRVAVTTLAELTREGDEVLVDQFYRMTTTERSANIPDAVFARSLDRWRLVGGEWYFVRTTTQALEAHRGRRRTFRARLDPADPGVSVELSKFDG